MSILGDRTLFRKSLEVDHTKSTYKVLLICLFNAFNSPSHPDHKYIWFRGGDLNR